MKTTTTTTVHTEAGKAPVEVTTITHEPETVRTVVVNETVVEEAGKAPKTNTTIRTKHETR